METEIHNSDNVEKVTSARMEIEICKLNTADKNTSPMGFEITAHVRDVASIKPEETLSSSQYNLLFPHVKWSLEIKKCTDYYVFGTSYMETDWMAIYLNCNADIPKFRCNAALKFTMVSQMASANDYEAYVTASYHPTKGEFGIDNFVRWSNIQDIEKGFLKDGAIILKAEVWAEPPHGGCWESRRKTGYVGLVNEVSCNYASSVLQMLFFTNQLTNAALSTQTSSVNGEKNITLALQRIFYELRVSEKVVSANKFSELFQQIYEGCHEYNYDEYLRRLIDVLRGDVKSIAYASPISYLFEGKIDTRIKCDNVDCELVKNEPFFEINLRVEGNSGIYEAMREFVKVEKLEGDCKYDTGDHGLQEAKKFLRFQSLPPVLHVHLRRFRYDKADGCSVKIKSKFEFYEKIDLAEFAICENEIDAKYTLQAVLVHTDEKQQNSHFVYISPNVDGIWYKFDNDVVCQVKKSEAIDGNFGYSPAGVCRSAVMLVYFKDSELEYLLQPVNEDSIFNICGCPPMEVRLETPVDFTNFLNSDSSFFDILILVGIDKSYKCHRALLSNESLYFEDAIFDEKEGGENIVDFRKHHFDTIAFESVLRYIYGGKCEVTWQNACDVFKVSLILLVNSIPEKSVKYARKHGLVGQIYKMLKMAIEFENARMCEIISSAIVSNYDFLVDTNVKSLNFDEMRFLVAKGCKIVKSQKRLLESVLLWAVEAENGGDYLSDLLNELDLKEIPIQDIKDLCQAKHIAEFERLRNPYFLLVLPLFKRLLMNDKNVVDESNLENVTADIDGDDSKDDSVIFKTSTDYSRLFRSGKFSDVNVRIGSQSFNCHRILLAGNSPFFNAMFTNQNFSENAKKEVDLNVHLESFADITNLIYSGRFAITSENIAELLKISAFLQVDVVRDKCVEYSRSNLTFDNVANVYVTACEHDIKKLIEITKLIILSNLQYLTDLGFLININLFGFRLLLEGSNSFAVPSHLLIATLKWVLADAGRIKSLNGLLSKIDLRSISAVEIRQICNENTSYEFRSLHYVEMGLLFERLLCENNTENVVSNAENFIYLAIKVKNQYHACKWKYSFIENIEKCSVSFSDEDWIFQDPKFCDVRIAVCGRKFFALKWDRISLEGIQFCTLLKKFAINCYFTAIREKVDRPLFPIPRNRRFPLKKPPYYVIPGMECFTVFSDFENASFYIFDDVNSTWKVITVCERSLFPEYGNLLAAGENNSVILTAESHSDFKLVDLRTKSIINIPKPQVFNEDATITLFNHRLYLFSVHNDVRISSMFDLFTNKWTVLPSIPCVPGRLYGSLQCAGVKNSINVFETRQFCDDDAYVRDALKVAKIDSDGDGEVEEDNDSDDDGEVKEENEIENEQFICFVHHFDVITQKWSKRVEIPAAVIHATTGSF